MEPKREHGDDRMMWRSTNVATGDWCVSEHKEDAEEVAGEFGTYDPLEFTVEQVLVTAEEWNAMPEFEGW